MKPSKSFILLLTLLLTLGIAMESQADISTSAVLFLRIAPGARAAGMGEAFVAIADDATATHWNPAGLGTYPLSGSWVESSVPEQLRPITAIATMRKGRGSGIQAYEIWAITAQGLARQDNNKWHLYESFQTKTSQTVKEIVSEYFNVTDDQKLNDLLVKVAQANNSGTLDNINSLRDSILAHVPETYDDFKQLSANLDSLPIAFKECRVRWEQIKEAKDQLKKGNEDGQLVDVEIDRINIAVEKAKTRFIPEELKVPYAAFFSDKLNQIAAADGFLVIGSENSLISYNGQTWKRHSTVDGLPSTNIKSLCSTGKSVFVGTDSGMVIHTGAEILPVQGSDQLPKGDVVAIGAAGITNVWAIIDDDLWHFDGLKWANSKGYQISLGDTPESIATKFALYKTDAEKTAWVEKFNLLNASLVASPVQKSPIDAVPPTEGESGEGEATPGEENENDESASDMSDMTEDSMAEITAEEAVLEKSTGTLTVAEVLTPGMYVEAPYLVSFSDHVNAIFVDVNNRVWLGTDKGVFWFDGTSWQVSGENRRINGISGQGQKVFLATDKGVVLYDGKEWRRADVRGINDANAIAVQSVGGEVWYSSDSRTVLAANGRSELAFMHVNWLPELANDLYYEFLSFVNEFDFGTVGINGTFISYGKFARTGEGSSDIIGEFESFDLAVTAAYGTSLTNKLKGGVAAKIIHSRLADQGAGEEQGKGTSTGFAVDFGLIYEMTDRLNLGMAITNIGPKMAYIDAAQADDLPRNLALGFAYKLMSSDYYQLLVTSEINKLLVGLDDGFKTELEQMVINSGAEFVYANTFALRGGYIYDQEGRIKTMTLGVGLKVLNKLNFDFAYIPNNSSVALANTLRVSLAFMP